MRDVPVAARAAKTRDWQRRAVTLAGVAALLYGTAGCSNPPGDIKTRARGGMAKLTVS